MRSVFISVPISVGSMPDSMSHLLSDDERKALIEFFNATNGPEWKYSTNWCSEEPLSQWYGVGTESGHVVTLNLGGNGLKGKPIEAD